MKNTYSTKLNRLFLGSCCKSLLLALGLASATAQAQTPTFDAMTRYPSGASGNYFVATGDLNGDGVLDMVTSNLNSSSVSVLLGRATGGFDPAVPYSMTYGDNPSQLALADLNQDNKLDVVVATQSTVIVLLGTGTGTLGASRYYTSMVYKGYGMKLYDVTRDGILDAVVTGTEGRVAVLPGTAAGTFGFASSYTAGSSPRGVSVGDFNHDGRADIVVSDAQQPNLYVLLGRASGGFATPVIYPIGRTAYFVETADLNRDGQLDILVSGYQNKNLSVLNGNADGTFGPLVTYQVIPTFAPGTYPPPPTDYLTGMAVGDVNGDGYPDVVVNDANNSKIYVLPGTSTGTLGAAVPFADGSTASAFGGNFPYEVKLADLNRDGKLDIVVAHGQYYENTLGTLLNTTVYSDAPTLTALSPTSGPVGASVTLTGTNLSGVTSVQFNGTAATTFTVVNATTLTATVPAGATTGPVTVTAPRGTATGPGFTVTYPDLVVNSTTTIPAGTYNSITINSPGVATLAGNVTVNTSTTVGSGATLNDGCFVLSGAGSFTLAAGGTLGICNAQGLSSTAGQGLLQNTGFRSLSIDATYVYNGTAAQVTGGQLPYQVRNLTSTNSNTVTLSQAVSVAQVLTLNAGNLNLNGRALTLLSSASGTALVANLGSGSIIGNVTVQRYIDPSLNPGLGYRHLVSPTTSGTVAAFGSGGTGLVVNDAYNTAANPGSVTPFPTIFSYDQSRVATSPATTLSAFDKGWVSPSALSEPAAPATTGYVVQLTGGQTLNFTGQVGNSSTSIAMSRNSGATAAEAGLSLIGNPYPAPLDLGTVTAGQRSNVDAAFYVFESTSQYGGSYRSFVNGVASTGGSSLVGTAQAFFARVTAGQTSGTLALDNTNRIISYGQPAAVRRTAADPRPLVRLDLQGASGPADSFTAYAEAGASAGFDGEYDAAKLPNSTGLNLSSATTTDNLAIDGRPAFTAATVLALNVGVPAAGTYTLTAASLANLPAGLTPSLRDAATGQLTPLTAGSVYRFSVTAAEATALLSNRFTLQFGTATALATTASLSTSAVSVYPNPAQSRFTVRVPAVAGASQVQAELLNALGQVVHRQAAALPAAGATLVVETAGLAAGVYTLRLVAGASTLAKRVVLQ